MNNADPPTTISRHDSADDFDAAGSALGALGDAMIGVSEFAARGVIDESSSALMR
jgi:hypothetical protein